MNLRCRGRHCCTDRRSDFLSPPLGFAVMADESMREREDDDDGEVYNKDVFGGGVFQKSLEPWE